MTLPVLASYPSAAGWHFAGGEVTLVELAPYAPDEWVSECETCGATGVPLWSWWDLWDGMGGASGVECEPCIRVPVGGQWVPAPGRQITGR